MLLPNFIVVVFAVTLLQVLFLSDGGLGLFRDSDTGWHIRNGEAILQSWTLPHVDAFSYTRQGQPWFAWEWLSDAVFARTYQSAGLAGVAVLAAVIIAVTASAVAQFTLSLGGNLFFTAGAVVLLLGTTSIHWLARPHVFSWIFALIFLVVAEKERRGGSRALYVLPILACLWANMHGSFLLGPAILLIYAVGDWAARAGKLFPSLDKWTGWLVQTTDNRWLEPTTPSARANEASRNLLDRAATPPYPRRGIRSLCDRSGFAGASLLCLVATFINPYGWHLHEHIFTYLQNAYLMDHISEFRSFSFHSDGALYVEIFLLVAILGILVMFRQRAFGPALLGIGLLHISLYSARHLPMAAVLVLPLAIAALTREARGSDRLRPLLDYADRLRSIDRRVMAVVPLALVIIATTAGVTTLAQAGSVGFNPQVFPIRAADFLERNNLSARIFSKDQWGGYLIYRFAGRTKVFIDGRSDFYGQQLLETYAQVVDVKPAWSLVLKQYDVGLVLIPPDHALAAILRVSSDWKPIYTDSVAAIFQRVR
jgi:hypothetical protein